MIDGNNMLKVHASRDTIPRGCTSSFNKNGKFSHTGYLCYNVMLIKGLECQN